MVVLFALVLFPLVALAVEPDPQCPSYQTFTTRIYWSWEVLSESQDVEEDDIYRRGRNPDEGFCFVVKLSDLEDPMQRAYGAKYALTQLIRFGNLNDIVRASKGKTSSEILFRYTGKNFELKKEWQDWWAANKDYLVWSNEADRLIIDAQAKRERYPISRFYESLPSKKFWLAIVYNHLKRIHRNKKGNLLLGLLNPGLYDGPTWVSMPVAVLGDRDTQEEVYKEFVDTTILYMLPDKKFEREGMESLKEYTGWKFNSAEAWVEWYENNKSNLALSEDRERLVIKNN